MGGNVPSHEEVVRFVQELARREGLEQRSTDRKTLEEERVAHV
jgi:hypothetical protein